MKKKNWARNSIQGILQNEFLSQTLQLSERRTRSSKLKNEFFPANNIPRNRFTTTSKFIIDNDSRVKVAWDIMVMLLTSYLSYVIPLSLSFYSDSSISLWYFVSSVYLLDILISCNTSYTSFGMKVFGRRLILKNYFRKWLLIDIISSFPCELLFLDKIQYDIDYPSPIDAGNTNPLRLLLLLKLLHIAKYKKIMFNLQDLFPGHFVYNLTSLFTYLLFVSLLLHTMACAFNAIYCINPFEMYDNTSQLFIDNTTRYLHFLLLFTETITSVGFGEFRTNTIEEKIFIIFSMAMTSGLLGFIIGGIDANLSKSNHLNYYFRDIQRRIKAFCNNNDIDKKLRFRINDFLRTLMELYLRNLFKEEAFLSLLSFPLKEEIFSYIRGDTLLRLDTLSELSIPCLRMIGYSLKLHIHGPNDLIIKEGQLTDELYFIMGGNFEVFHQQSSTTFKLLPKPPYFGEIGFFVGAPRTASVKSSGFSELLMLSKVEFDKILKTLPRDKEKIDTIKRNFKTYGLEVLDIHCYLCKELGHIASKCYQYIYNKPKPIGLDGSRKINVNKKLKREEQAFFQDKMQWRRLNLQSRRGRDIDASELFKDNPYLGNLANRYLGTVDVANRRNSKFLVMIDSYDKIDDEESILSDGSSASRDLIFGFELPRIGARLSFESQSDNLFQLK